jgi:outer membrane protein insertion porin family
LIVNITYAIKKNQKVYFEKIIIGGNTKTRDKVIRRQLRVYEQELYSGRRLKRSVRNLYRLDYFEEIKVDTQKGSSDDKMILKIDVTEKPTGTFSFGGGFSSVESLFAVASISQRNLFGRGQILQLKAQLGARTTQYTLSFTEPWFLDIPLSAGFDLYNWEQDYDDYDKDSKGGGIRLSYPVFDFTRASFAYAYEVADIKNIDEEAAREIKDLEGENKTSSATVGLRYDSRNKTFLPTEGQDHSLSVEYAGGPLGGDIGFIKFVGDTGWYFPLFWETVGFLHGKGGYVADNKGGKLPDYERFYLGGINSLRGFDFREISTKDSDGEEIGGDKFVQFNAEFIFPLIENAGLAGVAFFDAGNVYGERDNIDLTDLRKSAGLGIRWQSPLGPIRVEYGYVLDPEEGEGKGGKFEFAMGSSF